MAVTYNIYSTGQKKVNVSTVRYAPGALLVRSRFALGTLLVRSSSVLGAVRCGAVRFGAVGAVRSAYYRLCAHARTCVRLGFVHVADSCDVERSPC